MKEVKDMDKNNPSYSPELNAPPVEIRVEEKVNNIIEKIDELDKKIDFIINILFNLE
jgi:tetrahydromethanopterin S-methyltransferase subunit G